MSNGGTLVFSSAIAKTRLWSFFHCQRGQLRDGEMLALPSTGDVDYFPSRSLTGKMAYASWKTAESWNLWVRDLKTGTEMWLARVEAVSPYLISTVINSEGSRVAYNTCARDKRALYTISVSGATQNL